MEKKAEFVPLHKRIASAQGFNEENKKENEKRVSEIKEIFQLVGDTETGERMLSYLIDKFVTPIPERGMTAEDIMFMAGQESVVKLIVQLAQRGK